MSRVKQSTKSGHAGGWRRRDTRRFAGNPRRRPLGRRRYGARRPQALWGTMSRKRERHGPRGLGARGANRPEAASQVVAEYRHRPGCAAGCRDAPWWLGLAQARLQQSTAWARLLARGASALVGGLSLASRLLVRPGAPASAWLRRVGAHRRGRCALSLVRAMLSLLQQEPGLYAHLVPRMKLKLDRD